MGKLVRDLIPKIMSEAGKHPVFSELNANDFLHELKQKLIEEATEVSNAQNSQDIVEELCDVEEVSNEIRARLKISKFHFDAVRKLKKKERGGFSKRIYMEN